jgi:O-antigen ligase
MVWFQLAVCALALCLYGNSPLFQSSGVFHNAAIFFSGMDAKLFPLLPVFSFVALIGWRYRHSPRDFLRLTNPNLWLLCVVLIGAVVHAPSSWQECRPALAFLGSLVLGSLLTAHRMQPRKSDDTRDLAKMIIVALIVLFVTASIWHFSGDRTFYYHGKLRWTGPTTNPNLYGLLMSAGAILALGAGFSALSAFRDREGWRGRLIAFACVSAAVSMGIGLLNSYSRGAWLAVLFGLGYLGVTIAVSMGGRSPAWSRLRPNLVLLGVSLLSAAVLGFWAWRDTELPVARRVFSSGNQNDFSWRNRVAAWEGALQMIGDKPWSGFGWKQADDHYDYYYRYPRVDTSQAIETNDYLMLGATLGLPALICVVVFVWCSFRAKDSNGRVAVVSTWSFPLQKACVGSVVALLVGFWFDGGLFEVPTAVTFWTVIGLVSALHPRFLPAV